MTDATEETETEEFVTPRDFTEKLFGQYKEVDFGNGEPERWLDVISSRIGEKLRFRTYRIMKVKYQFLVGIFDELGNVLVCNANKYFLFESDEVIPAYLGFYMGSGTMWDMTPDEAKKECIANLYRRFYTNYTLRKVQKKGIGFGEGHYRPVDHYYIFEGNEFNPIPESDTYESLVYRMDMEYER